MGAMLKHAMGRTRLSTSAEKTSGSETFPRFSIDKAAKLSTHSVLQ